MSVLDWTVWQWLAAMEHELLLFAGVFFIIGALDDFAIDIAWLAMRLTGKAQVPRIDSDAIARHELHGRAAVFIPTWQESRVIGDTISHLLTVWPQQGICLYIGCYRNDAETIAAVIDAARGDPRLRLVIHDRDGPSTKADCLNRLYRALSIDEERHGMKARMVVFHDAEDMVDPAALTLLDEAIETAEFVQLPVLPLPQRDSRWIGSHYCEEFAEAHGKAMVVRDALRAAIPAAGVGCAVDRIALARLAANRGGGAPFAADSLTEDYELGIGIAMDGGRCRFVRARHATGELVATRAYFPSRIDQVVRQKTRWVHGIAFQGWDRLGWTMRPAETWMRVRDRRGPFTAIVLLAGYLLFALATFSWGANAAGYGEPLELSLPLKLLLAFNFFFFLWRATWRFAFTAREFGVAEGIRAVLRIPVANIIAIMAGRRALVAYAKTLAGARVVWDKTDHDAHPARMTSQASMAS